MQGYLASSRGHVAQVTPLLDDLRVLLPTGRAAALTAFGTGGLIRKEFTRFHAEDMSAPAFRHGPLEMVKPGLLALVFFWAT